jgi:hypothetical protein
MNISEQSSLDQRTETDSEPPSCQVELCETTVQKKCSNCGREFQCGAAAASASGGRDFSCWCKDLPHVSLVAAVDQDCLCPECLQAALTKLADDRKSSSPANATFGQ